MAIQLPDDFKDKPWRPPNNEESPEEVRQAVIRVNQRIDILFRRMRHVEQLLDANALWVDPT